MSRSERVESGGEWQDELAARIRTALEERQVGDPAERAGLAEALAAAIAEPIDQRLDAVYSQWADLTAGRAKELLRRSLQGSFRRELKHIIQETLREDYGERG